MASLTIKNIPDDLYSRLKQAANTHHRSINSELIVCLERVLTPGKTAPEERITAARTLRQRVKTPMLSADEIDAARREGRP